MSSTSFFLVMVAVLALVVNVSAGSVTETLYTASTVCTGASQTTTINTGGCTSQGTFSASVSCSGNTITTNTYTQANCAGTPTSSTVQAGQCVANTQLGQSAILTCSAAWTIAPSVMLTALLGMISLVALKSF